jgi:hypothetical protein
MLGLWLLVSPFIFAHASAQTSLWVNDLMAGGALMVLSLASFWQPTAWAHLLIIPLGGWLVLFGRLAHSSPLPAAFQNEIVIGLLVTMFAFVPNEASEPPSVWRDTHGDQHGPR